ncbi:hypothetical protein [Pseudodesulfovibrio sp. zrk46]|uniref:hypothetical protein n=1 Tax=Pseudodesulfovibrio sp. zrk46 TaxID=2725288 RepID=UPI001449E05B|nr:hypothetical protein [Pseudodesulfovibrio sp. zrk46]QJB56808.1 hypothetical protein HFN16_10495 [Pseudodesulfovibrio sp. zrk46]
MKSSKNFRSDIMSATQTLPRDGRYPLTPPYSYAGTKVEPAHSFLQSLSEIHNAGTAYTGKHDGKSGHGETLPRFAPRFRQAPSSRLLTANEALSLVLWNQNGLTV